MRLTGGILSRQGTRRPSQHNRCDVALLRLRLMRTGVHWLCCAAAWMDTQRALAWRKPNRSLTGVDLVAGIKPGPRNVTYGPKNVLHYAIQTEKSSVYVLQLAVHSMIDLLIVGCILCAVLVLLWLTKPRGIGKD